MSFIATQTFEFKDHRDELETIAMALDLIREKQYTQATAVLIQRHDALTRHPVLKPYNQNEVHV